MIETKRGKRARAYSNFLPQAVHFIAAGWGAATAAEAGVGEALLCGKRGRERAQ